MCLILLMLFTAYDCLISCKGLLSLRLVNLWVGLLTCLTTKSNYKGRKTLILAQKAVFLYRRFMAAIRACLLWVSGSDTSSTYSV